MKKSIVLGLAVLAFSSVAFGEGGANGGGGNTINGKPIESYGKKVDEFESYTSRITPQLQKLSSLTPHFAEAIDRIADSLVVYVIPRKFVNIGETRTGLHMATEQAALQCRSEVFIDEAIFNSMSSKEQAELLLHEVFIGAYINDRGLYPSVARVSKYCTDLGAFEHSGARKSVSLILNLSASNNADIAERLSSLGWSSEYMKSPEKIELDSRFRQAWKSLILEVKSNCRDGVPTWEELQYLKPELRAEGLIRAMLVAKPLVLMMIKSGYVARYVTQKKWELSDSEIDSVVLEEMIAPMMKDAFDDSSTVSKAIVEFWKDREFGQRRLLTTLKSTCSTI